MWVCRRVAFWFFVVLPRSLFSTQRLCHAKKWPWHGQSPKVLEELVTCFFPLQWTHASHWSMAKRIVVQRGFQVSLGFLGRLHTFFLVQNIIRPWFWPLHSSYPGQMFPRNLWNLDCQNLRSWATTTNRRLDRRDMEGRDLGTEPHIIFHTCPCHRPSDVWKNIYQSFTCINNLKLVFRKTMGCAQCALIYTRFVTWDWPSQTLGHSARFHSTGAPHESLSGPHTSSQLATSRLKLQMLAVKSPNSMGKIWKNMEKWLIMVNSG